MGEKCTSEYGLDKLMLNQHFVSLEMPSRLFESLCMQLKLHVINVILLIYQLKNKQIRITGQ